jgi:hypothetical protein
MTVVSPLPQWNHRHRPCNGSASESASCRSMSHTGGNLRTVTVSQVGTQIDGTTESLLFSAIHGLEHVCDSLRGCRVEIEGRDGSSTRLKPWRVKLLLSTSEQDIFVEGHDIREAATPREAILAAIREAELALLRMKSARECTTCCDQLSQRLPTAQPS